MVYFFSKLVPVLAHACATCSFSDASTPYYLKFIAFMTSLPLLFVGGVVLYLKNAKRRDETATEVLGHAADE